MAFTNPRPPTEIWSHDASVPLSPLSPSPPGNGMLSAASRPPRPPTSVKDIRRLKWFKPSHRNWCRWHCYNLINEGVDLWDRMAVLLHPQHQINWKSSLLPIDPTREKIYLQRSSFQNWCESCCNSFLYKASLTAQSIQHNILSFSNISNLLFHILDILI